MHQIFFLDFDILSLYKKKETSAEFSMADDVNANSRKRVSICKIWMIVFWIWHLMLKPQIKTDVVQNKRYMIEHTKKIMH